MKITTFAAIYIGSYEVSMKVFEISSGRKIRQVDHVRSRLELGRDAYSKGVIGYELVEELCQVLNATKNFILLWKATKWMIIKLMQEMYCEQ